MSSGPAPIGETPLATPLPCWHESLHAARHDVIVALSERRARIATARPLPSGTPVFIEFRSTHPGGAGIDAVAVASDGQAFVVEFITIDAGAAAVLAEALRPAPTATVLAPPAVIEAPITATVPVALATVAAAAATSTADEAPTFDAPALADGPMLAPPVADGPVDAPTEVAVAIDGPAPPIEVPPAERTGEFLTSSLILPPEAAPAGTDVDVVLGLVRTGEFLPIATPAPMGAATTATATDPASDAMLATAPSTGDEPVTASTTTTTTTTTTPSGPSWARALDADLGEEPDLGDVSHTQRWPTAHLATSSEEEALAARAEAPLALPRGADAPEPTDTTAPTTATTASVDVAATPAPAAWTPPVHDDRDETTRWPVARAVVNTAPPVAAPVVAAPVVAAPVVAPVVVAVVDAGSAPPMAFEDGEEVVLEFTAPQRPAVREIPARPLPPPDDAGVVEVDFSEFRDVLGVATFRAETAPRASLGQRVATPEPISITLPRTPSTSLQQVSAQAPAKNPFGGDSGVGPRPDSSPPVANPIAITATAPADQWVVSSPPSLPAPRLLDGDFDRVLRSGGSNSVTPKPLPFHDSSPPTTPGLLGGASLSALATDPPAPVTTTTAVTTTAVTTPRVVPAARSPFAVPPVSPVIAPRPPAVVPVVAPLRPPVPVTLPPRPAMPSLPPLSLPPLAPVALSTSMPPTPMVTPTMTTATTPTVTTATTPTAAALPATMTPPSSTPAHLQSVTPSAEGLPLIVGEHGDDT